MCDLVAFYARPEESSGCSSAFHLEKVAFQDVARLL